MWYLTKLRIGSKEQIKKRRMLIRIIRETCREIHYLRERAMEELKVWIPATSVTLEWLSHLTWWALKSPNTKIFADDYREWAISILWRKCDFQKIIRLTDLFNQYKAIMVSKYPDVLLVYWKALICSLLNASYLLDIHCCPFIILISFIFKNINCSQLIPSLQDLHLFHYLRSNTQVTTKTKPDQLRILIS